jgi:hypothetical protein
MLDEQCLIRFVRRSVANAAFEISEIGDFQLHIGCPAEQVLPLLLNTDSGRLQQFLALFLARLRAFPAEIAAYVNLKTAEAIWSGGKQAGLYALLHILYPCHYLCSHFLLLLLLLLLCYCCCLCSDVRIAGSDCAQLLDTMRKFPQTCQAAEPTAAAPFVQFVSRCVASESLELSEAAFGLFCSLARDETAAILAPDAHPVSLMLPIARQHLVSGDSTIALRYGALICSVAGTGDALFAGCLSAGAVDLVTQLCRTPDELVQVSDVLCCALMCSA